jgi:hypothetical protein
MTDSGSATPNYAHASVTPEFDAKVRADLSAAYRRAPAVLDLGMLDETRNIWKIGPGSHAERELLVKTRLFMYLVAEIDGGTNLPLSQARSLLADAAATFVALGLLTIEEDSALRFAAIAPLARSIAERAATVAWVLTASTAEQRLRRALLVELRGLEFLLAYLPEARRNRNGSDLEHARDRFLEIADVDAGGYELDKKGLVLRVGGETRPTLTSVVSEATVSAAYAELSAHAHPTGYLHLASAEWSRGGNGQVWFERKSTVHDEGRLCESAVLAFARAVVAVADQIGCNSLPATEWAVGIARLWGKWCRSNGCA